MSSNLDITWIIQSKIHKVNKICFGAGGLDELKLWIGYFCAGTGHIENRHHFWAPVKTDSQAIHGFPPEVQYWSGKQAK